VNLSGGTLATIDQNGHFIALANGIVTVTAAYTEPTPAVSGQAAVDIARKIAFESYRNGNYDIYVMNSDGTSQTRLTNNLAVDFVPCWSPF
jgi:TolB protein